MEKHFRALFDYFRSVKAIMLQTSNGTYAAKAMTLAIATVLV